MTIPFFNSLKDFLNSDIETDVVTIATPNGLHASNKQFKRFRTLRIMW